MIWATDNGYVEFNDITNLYEVRDNKGVLVDEYKCFDQAIVVLNNILKDDDVHITTFVEGPCVVEIYT